MKFISGMQKTFSMTSRPPPAKAKEGVRVALYYNEKLKNSIDADVVAITQLIQAGRKIVTQINLLGITGRAYVKEVNKTKYIIFKGNAKLRPNLRGTRYLAENAKVRCFVVGTKDILEDTAKGTKIAIVAFIAIDIIQEVTSDHPSFTSLGIQISSDVLQTVVAAYAGAAAGVVLTTLGAPVVLVFIAVVVIGYTVGMLLSRMDREYKLTDRAKARMKGWEEEVKKEIPVIKQQVITTSKAAYRTTQSLVRSEVIVINKYYQSATAMMSDSFSTYASELGF